MQALKNMDAAGKRKYCDRVVIPYLTGLLLLAFSQEIDASGPTMLGFATYSFGIGACMYGTVVLWLQATRDSFEESEKKAPGLFIGGMLCAFMLYRWAVISADLLPAWGEHLHTSIVCLLLIAYLRWRFRSRTTLPDARVIT